MVIFLRGRTQRCDVKKKKRNESRNKDVVQKKRRLLGTLKERANRI